ncbi:thioesterase [Thermus composti]|uniref:Acyl-CoA thioesterase n=1 Tax=Thermus composti TaxID=532059 RepID=A0ABV6Q2G8_9DEIN|nr:thioesterase family protein [Thermus composti]GGM98622.1 thioesterase [Thermus composti]
MEGFPVTVRVDVRFRDLDPLGHVNNAVFLSYMELARIRYFQRISPDWLEEGHFVVARMEVDYLKPILLEDEVYVGVRTLRIGRSSLHMEHFITANGQPAAKGIGVLVWLEGGRPAPIPQAVRDRIAELEGRDLPS